MRIPNVQFGVISRGQKKHRNFFNISFFETPPKTPLLGPPEKIMCLISWERAPKRDPHKLFLGHFGVKKGVPNRPFWATTKV